MGPTIVLLVFKYGIISLVITSIPHAITPLEGRREEEVAKLLGLQSKGLPWPRKGPENSACLAGSRAAIESGNRSVSAHKHCQHPEGPPEGPCRPGSGFPHGCGTQLPTLAVNGSGFQVTHMNKMQKNNIVVIGIFLSARPGIVL